MNHKRTTIIQNFKTINSKILCSRFSSTSCQTFACGDNSNNLIIYSMSDSNPIETFSSTQSNTSPLSSVTACQFVNHDRQILAGSNRGSISCWDIQQGKVSFWLKGHTVEICTFWNVGNMVVSGGLDTNAKIWDLRIKQCINTLKSHNKKVSAICSTSDFRYIVTGGQDGQIFTYDLRASKQLFQYQPNSPVLSIDLNNNGLISAGCFDRVARIYSINNPSYQRKDIKTKMDTMPIICNKFYQNRYIFTAGSQILKLWEVVGDKLVMRDGIQGGTKGLLDMYVGEDRVRLVGCSGGVLGGYECLMSEMWFEGKQQKEKEEGKVWMVNNSIYGESDSFNSPSANKLPSRNSQNQNSSIAKRSTSVQPFYTKVPQTQQISKKNEALSKQLADIHGNINQALQNMKSVSQNLNNKKVIMKQFEQLTNTQHFKFMKIIQQRIQLTKQILEYCKKGKMKQLINKLQMQIYLYQELIFMLHLILCIKYQNHQIYKLMFKLGLFQHKNRNK